MRDLRISVTDRCNFRCTYCMPFDEYNWIERNQVLSFEEIVRLTDIFSEFGIHKVRLTGGEPLVRRNLDGLVRQLSIFPGLEVSLTTNGALLGEQAAGLFDGGPLPRFHARVALLWPSSSGRRKVSRRMTCTGTGF